MMNKKLKTIVAIMFAISSLISSTYSVQATSSANIIRLQKASEALTNKGYHAGYLSFRPMARNGCPYSQCILGIMHQKGLGVSQNNGRALYWFQRSARQGFPDAQNRLGLMYLNGEGVKKNLHLAKQWLTKAANQGIEEARELLAKIPGENNLANTLTQLPHNTTESAQNIKHSWQGYSEITKQLTQLASTASSN